MQFITPLYEKVENLWVGLVKLLPLLAIALLVLLLTWILAKVLSGLLRKSLNSASIRQSLKNLFGSLLQAGIWTAGIMSAITIVFPSLTPGKLLTALGLVSVAVGLAFKDIFENFFAGILILLRKPMRIGDYIESGDVSGRVEYISLRETYLREVDDQLVLVPNSYLFKNPVCILTDKSLRLFEIVVGVAYGEKVNEARSVIETALGSLELGNEGKPIEVYAREFNSSSLDFTVRWWAESTPLSMHQTKDKVVTAIKYALDDANIEIPFPYRTLTFKEPLTIEKKSEDS